MSSLSSSPLPALVLRNLGDRSNEKRKQAALEIEHLIKELNNGPNKNSEAVKSIISTLVRDYAYSTQSNQRKGGLIGLAATSIALMEETNFYLEMLLPPVLKCFTDQENRVRFYACEALYNITKVARGAVLIFFNEIFDGLCKLYADVDLDVKNGAQLLDRLMKDVVTECDSFDINKFIPLLKERIRIKNPFIRQLLVGWIIVLDSVPEIDMVEYLPEFLSGLFDMLSDPNKDIRQQAFAALAELLREVTQSTRVELGPVVSILVSQSENRDNFTRLTVLSWLNEFITLGNSKVLPFLAEILGSAIQSISDSEKEIRQKAEKTNESLLKLVEQTNESILLGSILNKLLIQISNKWVPSRLATLRWISMLLIKYQIEMTSHLNELFPPLLKTLQDPDDSVVRTNLEVLAQLSLYQQSNNNSNDNSSSSDHRVRVNSPTFHQLLNHLIKLFSSDRKFLESRGSLIIRQLCEFLDSESIYRSFALNLIENIDNLELEFISLMIQTLNLILLTSGELVELRQKLKRSIHSSEGAELFNSLYKAWCHNSIATFSLCLLAQTYELSSALIFQLSNTEMTVGTLMQIDKLVQLLESPIFIHLRLQLLEPNQYPFLLKSLYGILMLLPQSQAFHALKIRLESVAPIGQLLAMPHSNFATAAAIHQNQLKSSNNSTAVAVIPPKESNLLDFHDLLQYFNLIQSKQSAKRLKQLKEVSLINRKTGGLNLNSSTNSSSSSAAVSSSAALSSSSKSGEEGKTSPSK